MALTDRTDSNFQVASEGPRPSPPQVQVNRRAFRLESFNAAYRATKPARASPKRRIQKVIASNMKPTRFCNIVLGFFPIINWVRNYNIRQDLLADLVCGVTIAIFHVPQAMAYAQVAKVEPVYGLYSAFFPVIIYFLMGTSRQLAMGTFAVGSLMMGAINAKWVGELDTDNTLSNHTTPLGAMYRQIDVTVTVALWAGILQIIFWIFRLGALSVFLSEHLVSGFTCASALYIFTSQVGTMFGIALPSVSGPFNLIITYINLFERIDKTNVASISLTIVAIVILIVFKELINPQLAKCFPAPFPIELCLVIFGTVASSYIDLKSYKVKVVGFIETGLPAPKAPPTELMGTLAVDSLILTIILFSQSVSLGKIFGKKHGYEIDANQELLTLGVANILGSFFFCIPSGGSLSRTSVQDGVDGRTQLVSIINCIGLLIVLYALGPLLEDLPNCILSAIITVSLKHMLWQVCDLPKYWKISKVDGLTWVITFIAVFILDVDIGLGVGVGFSLITLLVRSQMPNTYLMGVVEHTDVYVPLQRYLVAREVPGFKIWKFDGPLHFGNIEYFGKELAHSLKNRKNVQRPKDLPDEDPSGFSRIPNGNSMTVDNTPFTNIIIDCSAISFVDSSGVRTIKEVYEEYQKQGITISLACCSSQLYSMLKRSNFFSIAPTTCVFPTIQDAILFQQKHKNIVPDISTLLSLHISEEHHNVTKL